MLSSYKSVNSNRVTRTSPHTSGVTSTLDFSIFADFNTVLPWNVRWSRNKKSLQAYDSHNQKWVNCNSIEEANSYVNAKFTTCPLSGKSVPYGIEHVGRLCSFLKKYHNDTFEKLKNEASGKINQLYIYDGSNSI